MILHRHTGLDSPRVYAKNISGLLTGDDVMLLIGNQTVAGIKTFSSIPILPAVDPTADNEWVRKAYIDGISIPSEINPYTEIIDAADNQVDIDIFQTFYTKVKQITYNEEDGDINIKFDLLNTNGAGDMYGRVYVNNIAVGTERVTGSSSWTTYSEDFSVENGDTIQIYIKFDDTSGGIGGSLRNFRLYYIKDLTVTVGTVNLN